MARRAREREDVRGGLFENHQEISLPSAAPAIGVTSISTWRRSPPYSTPMPVSRVERFWRPAASIAFRRGTARFSRAIRNRFSVASPDGGSR